MSKLKRTFNLLPSGKLAFISKDNLGNDKTLLIAKKSEVLSIFEKIHRGRYFVDGVGHQDLIAHSGGRDMT